VTYDSGAATNASETFGYRTEIDMNFYATALIYRGTLALACLTLHFVAQRTRDETISRK